MRTARFAVMFLLALAPTSIFASLSQQYVDWGKGPVQWIMTRDELKTWKSVSSDADAEEFIDLFWARRDPTPGTFPNEFKADFDLRVAYADKEFADRTQRGSMSDRGRVLIVLGWPTNMDKLAAQQRAMGTVDAPTGDSQDSAGGALRGVRLGARDEWLYENADAQKFDMPKIDVVFIQDPVTKVVIRDTQRHDFMAALPAAIEKPIVNRDLRVAPEWSKRPAVNVAFVPATRPSISPTAAVRKGEAGAHGLILTKDAMALASPQSGMDPFAGVGTVASFAAKEDLGYAFEYCGAAETLKMTINIHGTAGGKKVNMVAPTEDVPVEAIKVVPGCGMVRASVPLGDLQVASGAYTFSLKLEDGAQSYNLAQDFKIE